MGLPGGARSRAAFTLLEILIAVALLGLLSAALVTGANHLLDNRARTPAEVFWEAARDARRTALESATEVRLSFSEKEKTFVADDGRGQKTFSLVEPPRELAVSLLPAQSTNGSLLIGGQLVETEAVPFVSFYPDGTCTPFRIQFRTTGPATVIAIDPWTCAPMLLDEENR
jgi:general secretion pathway protein H